MTTTLVPMLSFAGTTREAFAFYEQALGARITAMLSFAQMPEGEMPDDACGNGWAAPRAEDIMHACLELPGGAQMYAGDLPPGAPHNGFNGVTMALELDTVEEAARAFEALSQGGKVTMPIAPAFWAGAFGMLIDRFGVAWAINGAPIPLP